MTDVIKGRLVVAGGVLAFTLCGLAFMHRPAPATTLPAADAAAIDTILSSPQIAAAGMHAGQPRLVDSVTQGDDTMDIVRVEATDPDGAMTIYFVVENGRVIDAEYAQNGSAR